jgi:hypothetical protein
MEALHLKDFTVQFLAGFKIGNRNANVIDRTDHDKLR